MAQETSPSSEGGTRSGPPRSGPRRDGPSGGGGSGGRYGGPPGLRRPRRKVCTFCVDKVQRIDYKDVGRIRRYISDRGKRGRSGAPLRTYGTPKTAIAIRMITRIAMKVFAPGLVQA